MANIKKSSNFDRNMDFDSMEKQIKKNLYEASDILAQSSNAIAPINKGKLRGNLSKDYSGLKAIVTWEQPYAGKVYETNFKNPQTTKWIEKGYAKKKSVLDKISTQGVLK